MPRLPNLPAWQKAPPDARRWSLPIGIGLFVLGFLLVIIAGADLARQAMRGLHRLNIPGTHELKLYPGLHSGFLDPGFKRSSSAAPSLFVTVEDSGTGTALPVYAGPGGRGPLFQFQIMEPAEYRLTAVGNPKKIILVHGGLAESRAGLWVALFLCLIMTASGIYVIRAGRKKTASAA